MLVMELGCTEAAKRTGIPLNTVLSWSARGNWLKPEARLPATVMPRAIDAIKPADALQSKLAELDSETRLSLAKGLHKGAEHVAQLAGPDILAEAKSIHSLTQSTALVHSWKGIASESNSVLNIAFLQSCGTQPEQAKAHIVEEQ